MAAARIARARNSAPTKRERHHGGDRQEEGHHPRPRASAGGEPGEHRQVGGPDRRGEGRTSAGDQGGHEREQQDGSGNRRAMATSVRPRPREAPASSSITTRTTSASAAPGCERHQHRDRDPETGGEAPSSIGGFVRAERGLEALGGGGQDREGHQQVEPALREGPHHQPRQHVGRGREHRGARAGRQPGRGAVHQDGGQRRARRPAPPSGRSRCWRTRARTARSAPPRRGSPSAVRRAASSGSPTPAR